MRANLTKIGCALLIGAGFALVLNGQQKPTPTIADYNGQIADCAISLRMDARYEADLVAQIQDLQKQLAAAKAALDSQAKANPPKP